MFWINRCRVEVLVRHATIMSNAYFLENIDFAVKELKELWDLMYRMRDLFLRKCLLLFYILCVESTILYGSLACRSATKTRLKKLKEEILRAIFHCRRVRSLSDILTENKVLFPFEFYIAELVEHKFGLRHCDKFDYSRYRVLHTLDSKR